MSRCKVCGCLGWLFSVSAAGLCSACSHMLSLEVAERSRRIEDSLRGADQTINLGSKIDRLDETLAQLAALSHYEERGIQTLQDSPGALLGKVRRRRDEVVAQAAEADLNEALGKVAQTPHPEQKIAHYSALLIRLTEYKRRMDHPERLAEMEARVKEGAHRIRLNIPLDKARLAENRGELAKALGFYRDALTFLRSSDPERKALAYHIPEIEDRIRTLERPKA